MEKKQTLGIIELGLSVTPSGWTLGVYLKGKHKKFYCSHLFISWLILVTKMQQGGGALFNFCPWP